MTKAKRETKAEWTRRMRRDHPDASAKQLAAWWKFGKDHRDGTHRRRQREIAAATIEDKKDEWKRRIGLKYPHATPEMLESWWNFASKDGKDVRLPKSVRENPPDAFVDGRATRVGAGSGPERLYVVHWDLGDTEFEDMPYEQGIKAAGLPPVIDNDELKGEELSDWLSNEYGFTHFGFEPITCRPGHKPRERVMGFRLPKGVRRNPGRSRGGYVPNAVVSGHGVFLYPYYVVVDDVVVSGWDYKEDAKEHASEIKEDLGFSSKVYTKKTVESRGLEVADLELVRQRRWKRRIGLKYPHATPEMLESWWKFASKDVQR